MSENESDQHMNGRLSDFYDGKSIFLTGASGFVGSVLLETLLRCFPGIQKIYILIRKKKGIEPDYRKQIIFQKLIFKTILKDEPNITDKVHVVPGEITMPNLGMSNENLMKIVEEVSIVFHCAASVSFTKPLRSIVQQNCVGTNNVIEICRKLNNLAVLVYTSTAFSNCNYSSYIEEHIYRLPFPAKRFLDALESDDYDTFEKLVANCKPDWPNHYTFSKSLAENILQDNASNLPVVIVRPGIVVSAWKGILPGYTEEGNGVIDFGLAVSRGFLRVVIANYNSYSSYIPIDLVSNTHVIAAWSTATKRPSSPTVINCTAGHFWKVTFGEYCDTLANFGRNNCLPLSFTKPSIKVINSKFFFTLYAIYEHYVPALFFDILMILKGASPMMVSAHKFFDNLLKNYNFFITNNPEFEVHQFCNLTEQLSLKDKELLCMDFDGINIKDLVDRTFSSSFMDWKSDKKSKQKRKRTVLLRSVFINVIKKAQILFLCWMAYLTVNKILY